MEYLVFTILTQTVIYCHEIFMVVPCIYCIAYFHFTSTPFMKSCAGSGKCGLGVVGYMVIPGKQAIQN